MNKEEFLLDMLDYYTVDPEGRRCRNNKECVYSSKSISKTSSEGCAIGRHLNPDLAKQLDEDTIGDIIDVFSMRKEYLPDWMQIMGKEFLSSCQTLHDSNRYWTDKELTHEGRRQLKFIVMQYDLDLSKFKRYL